MTRKQVEEMLYEYLRGIEKLVSEYYDGKEKGSRYLALFVSPDHVSANNEYWELPQESHIDFWASKVDGEWEDEPFSYEDHSFEDNTRKDGNE